MSAITIVCHSTVIIGVQWYLTCSILRVTFDHDIGSSSAAVATPHLCVVTTAALPAMMMTTTIRTISAGCLHHLFGSLSSAGNAVFPSTTTDAALTGAAPTPASYATVAATLASSTPSSCWVDALGPKVAAVIGEGKTCRKTRTATQMTMTTTWMLVPWVSARDCRNAFHLDSSSSSSCSGS